MTEFTPERVTADGTKVFLDVHVYRGRDGEGRLTVTDRGLLYVGELRIETPWSKVVHIHRQNAQDFSVQEAKRRSATKFGLGVDRGWDESFAIIEWCWRTFGSPDSAGV
jgi:hypothetical protein